jgi:hypothetical protein
MVDLSGHRVGTIPIPGFDFKYLDSLGWFSGYANV